MKIYRIASNIEYKSVDDFDDYFEDMGIDVFQGIELVEKSSGINILRGKEPTMVAILNNSIVGVLWEEFDGQEYSFDVAVLPEYRRLGIGKELIDIPLSNFSQCQLPLA